MMAPRKASPKPKPFLVRVVKYKPVRIYHLSWNNDDVKGALCNMVRDVDLYELTDNVSGLRLCAKCRMYSRFS